MELKPRLEYIGIQPGVPEAGIPDQKMYNVFNSDRPDLHPDRSSILEDTAYKLGWL